MSVVCLSVTFVHPCHRVELRSQYFCTTLQHGHRATLMPKTATTVRRPHLIGRGSNAGGVWKKPPFSTNILLYLGNDTR